MKQEGKRFKVHLYQMKLNANPRAENKSVSTSYCGGKWGTGVFRCKSNSEVEEREAGCIPTHWQRAYSLFELQCWPAKHARSCTYTSVCTPEDRWGMFTSAHVMLPRIPGDALCKWCRLWWWGWRMETSHQHNRQISTVCASAGVCACVCMCVCVFFILELSSPWLSLLWRIIFKKKWLSHTNIIIQF